MRHDPILRWTAWAVLAAAVAGCGSTGGRSRGGKEEISQTGQANVHLAQSYMQAGKYELALDRVDRALRSDPGSADAHVVKGLILERLDQRASAGEHYVRAAKLAPEKGFALNAAGVFLCENRNFAEAEAM